MRRIKQTILFAIIFTLLFVPTLTGAPEKLDLSIGVGYNGQIFNDVSSHGIVVNIYIADTWKNNGVFLADMSVNAPLQITGNNIFIGLDSQFRIGAEYLVGGGYEFNFDDELPLALTVGTGLYVGLLGSDTDFYAFIGVGAMARGRYSFSDDWSADFGIRIGVPFVGFTPYASGGIGISTSTSIGINYKFDYVPPITRNTRFYMIEHKGEHTNYYEGGFY